MTTLSNFNAGNRFRYVTPENKVIISFDYREILKNNIMLNSDLGRNYRFIKNIELNNINNDFEFGIATAPKELREILRLRFLSYSEEGYIDQNYFSEGLEYDKYDANSVMFFVRNLKTNNLHACMRLVFDSEIGLPLEEFISIDDFRSENKVLCEISRLISYPKGQRAVNRSIVAFAYRFALNYGITHIMGFGRWDKLRYYESIGLRILEPLRKVRYEEVGNGHMPPGEFYGCVLDLKNPISDKSSIISHIEAEESI